MALREEDAVGRDNSNKAMIVAIGASAGGIPALQSFFSGIRPDAGAAFIIVVHLDPQRHSELSAIVSARTYMPVVQVASKVHLEAKSNGLTRPTILPLRYPKVGTPLGKVVKPWSSTV